MQRARSPTRRARAAKSTRRFSCLCLLFRRLGLGLGLRFARITAELDEDVFEAAAQIDLFEAAQTETCGDDRAARFLAQLTLGEHFYAQHPVRELVDFTNRRADGLECTPQRYFTAAHFHFQP